MKTKYSSNSELCHIWATDPQPEISKSANSVSCHNDILYSYSTAIGQIVDNNTVIYNTHGYSVTTSKHQGLMQYATNHFNKRIYLDIPKRGLNSLVFNQNEFNDILSYNERIIGNFLLKASRSKKYKDRYNSDALKIINNLKLYAETFGLVYNAPNTDKLTESALKADKESRALAKIRNAERIAKQAEDLQKWRNGDSIYRYFEITALRIKEDQIETTKGAKIPLDHAIKFWGLIKYWHETKMTYIKDHHSIKLGHYTVNSFRDDILTVGCHSIPYNEIASIANQLQLQGA